MSSIQLDLVSACAAAARVESAARLPRTQPRSIQAQFEEFHQENPQVYSRLVQLARGLATRGHTRVGIGMLWEVLRWDNLMSTTGVPYKLNNNFRSRYARLIEAHEPDLVDLFDKRELHSA